MTAFAGALRDATTMTRRDLIHSMRSPGTSAIALITPVFLLFMFVYVFGGSLSVGSAYIDYVAPGILMITATYGCTMTAVRLAADMKEGIIDRFRTMAITRGSVLTGQVVGTAIRTSLSCVIVLALMLLMGFRPVVDPLAWLAVAGLLLLVIVAITWVTVAGALLAKTPEGASYTTILVVLLPFVLQRLCAHREHAGLGAVVRGEPALHARDRHHAGAADGDSRGARLDHRRRLVRGLHRHRIHRRQGPLRSRSGAVLTPAITRKTGPLVHQWPCLALGRGNWCTNRPSQHRIVRDAALWVTNVV